MNKVSDLKPESVKEEILQDSQGAWGRAASCIAERLVLKLWTVEK